MERANPLAVALAAVGLVAIGLFAAATLAPGSGLLRYPSDRAMPPCLGAPRELLQDGSGLGVGGQGSRPFEVPAGCRIDVDVDVQTLVGQLVFILRDPTGHEVYHGTFRGAEGGGAGEVLREEWADDGPARSGTYEFYRERGAAHTYRLTVTGYPT